MPSIKLQTVLNYNHHSPAWFAGATKAVAAATIRARKNRTRAMVELYYNISTTATKQLVWCVNAFAVSLATNKLMRPTAKGYAALHNTLLLSN
jgi:hypothetical protein